MADLTSTNIFGSLNVSNKINAKKLEFMNDNMVYKLNGASYSIDSGTLTGIIQLLLPIVSGIDSKTMGSIEINGFYHTHGSFKILIGFYNFDDNIDPTSTNVSIFGNFPFDIRLGVDTNNGNRMCILLGNTGTVHAHPKMVVNNVMYGFINAKDTDFNEISFNLLTSEAGITKIMTPKNSDSVNNVIARGTSAPLNTALFWLNTNDSTLNYHNGTSWLPIRGSYA